MELPNDVAVALNMVEAPVEVLDCDPAFADTAQFCERYGYPLTNSANTIIVASRRGPQVFAACVIAADDQLDVNHAVRRELGAPKLSFASAEETKELTGMEIGGVTVFGLPPGLPLLVERSLFDLDYIILGAGTRSAKLKAPPRVLGELPRVRVADLRRS